MNQNDKHREMEKKIAEAIQEASIGHFKCSGYQNEHSSELELEEYEFDDLDSVVNNILAIVSDYVSGWI